MRFHVSLQTSIKSNKTLFAMGKNLIEIFLLRYINFFHIPEDVTGLNWKGFSHFCRKGPFDNFIRYILCKHMSLWVMSRAVYCGIFYLLLEILTD